jgi:general secretion pathway protein D
VGQQRFWRAGSPWRERPGTAGCIRSWATISRRQSRLIATAGKAQLLSRPSILARDGQMAEIVVGQFVYLPSSVSLTSVGGTATTVPSINGSYQNVGIQLDVTPFIGANNLVQMILQPQITSIDTSTPGQVIEGGSLFASAVYAPNLDKRSANTVVVTPDGQTVVIGGLISNDKSSSESKVPLLGDIPLLGNLFKFTSKANQKDELLMFITPHIVQMPSQLAALSARETGQAPTHHQFDFGAGTGSFPGTDAGEEKIAG